MGDTCHPKYSSLSLAGVAFVRNTAVGIMDASWRIRVKGNHDWF